MNARAEEALGCEAIAKEKQDCAAKAVQSRAKAEKMALSPADKETVERLLSLLTREEKVALVTGTEFMCTNPIPRLSIPALRMADGPHGLRKQVGKQNNGPGSSLPATVFPTAVTVAASFRPENARRLGEALGDECRAQGVQLLLGPGLNIKRSHRCGRNFEYYSEDVLLAAEMAAEEVNGLQSRGVGAVLKHYAANNSETHRIFGDSVMSLRALYEVYLGAFEGVLARSSPLAVMSAYNRVRGEYASESGELLSALREKFGYEGVVMTDWGAMRKRVPSLLLGVDLEMPGDNDHSRHALFSALQKEESDGKREEATGEKDAQGPVFAALDAAVRRILTAIYRAYRHFTPLDSFDAAAHHALAADIAADGAVLLKNEKDFFPLRKGKRRLIVGELFTRLRYQGAGSSMGAPTALSRVKEAYDKRETGYLYALGYRLDEEARDASLEKEALLLAEGVDEILVFCGLSDSADSESADRPHLHLRENQLALIEALLKTGKPLGLVLYGGGVIELPFAEAAAGILHMLLPGQNGGEATARLLFGERSPSGRLPETFVASAASEPFDEDFGKYPTECYREDIFVGYKYHALYPEGIRYPFGYGLSYTRFEAKDFSLSLENGRVLTEYTLSNVGERAGAEVMQLYALPPESAVYRAPRALVAFLKTDLEKGEEKRLSLSFPLSALTVYDEATGRRVLPGGEYTLVFGKNALEEWGRLSFFVKGEDVAPSSPFNALYKEGRIHAISRAEFLSAYPHYTASASADFTVDSPLPDMKKKGLFGRLLYGAMHRIMTADGRRASHSQSAAERRNLRKGAEFASRILERATLRFISSSSGGLLSYTAALGVAHLVNGHPIKAIGAFLSRERVPRLPEKSKKRRKNPPKVASLVSYGKNGGDGAENPEM